MKQTSHRHLALWTALTLSGISAGVQAQQWTGANQSTAPIWREGQVGIGVEPGTDSTAALLEIRRPLSGTDPLLFRATSSYKQAIGTKFEIDTERAYAGGARTQAAFLPGGEYDFAVGKGVAINTSAMTAPIPTGYRLAVGGKIIAEEVRVKLIKNWSDYVFRPDYRLAPLPDIEGYIRAHGHLPGIPNAAEVEANGVEVGQMQAKLLAKIEELTLHAIAQQKAIDGLRAQLARVELERTAAPHAEQR